MANVLAEPFAGPLRLPQLAPLTDEQGRPSNDETLEGKAGERILEFALFSTVEDP